MSLGKRHMGIVDSQRVLVEILLNEDARRAWAAAPHAYAAARLEHDSEIEMVAGLDPRGLSAAAASLVEKEAMWNHFHDLGHRVMARRRADQARLSGHDENHDHSHEHHGEEGP